MKITQDAYFEAQIGSYYKSQELEIKSKKLIMGDKLAVDTVPAATAAAGRLSARLCYDGWGPTLLVEDSMLSIVMVEKSK